MTFVTSNRSQAQAGHVFWCAMSVCACDVGMHPAGDIVCNAQATLGSINAPAGDAGDAAGEDGEESDVEEVHRNQASWQFAVFVNNLEALCLPVHSTHVLIWTSIVLVVVSADVLECWRCIVAETNRCRMRFQKTLLI